MNTHTLEMLERLTKAGIILGDALHLRRIAMTLHHWSEMECGMGDGWGIERDGDAPDSKPYMVHHGARGEPTRYPIPDRETGALRRLDAIMAAYPTLSYYVQGDPRGAPLYILRPGDIPAGEDIAAYYTRGIAVYK